MRVLTENVDGRKFISQSSEAEISAICHGIGAKFLPINSPTSKTREIKIFRKGNEESIYYMRQEGLSKGILRIVVNAKIGSCVDKSIEGIDGVNKHMVSRMNDNPRYLYNANFKAYKNKHDRGLEKEHYGWAYDVEVANGFHLVEKFLRAFSD